MKSVPQQAYSLYTENGMTGKEIAKVMNVKERTVYYWIEHRGEIKDVGRPHLLNKDELETLKKIILDKQEKGSSLTKYQVQCEV